MEAQSDDVKLIEPTVQIAIFSERNTLNSTSKADNWFEIIIIGTLSCLIILVCLAIIACFCCYRKRKIRSARPVMSSLSSSAVSQRSLHHNTVGKSLYLASDIKTVPSDEVDTLNRQFMLLKRCSRVQTTESASKTSETASTCNRATSSLGEALKPPASSTPTNSELRMPTKRSHRPESTVKIVEVTSSLEERQKLRKLTRRNS